MTAADVLRRFLEMEAAHASARADELAASAAAERGRAAEALALVGRLGEAVDEVERADLPENATRSQVGKLLGLSASGVLRRLYAGDFGVPGQPGGPFKEAGGNWRIPSAVALAVRDGKPLPTPVAAPAATPPRQRVQRVQRPAGGSLARLSAGLAAQRKAGERA